MKSYICIVVFFILSCPQWTLSQSSNTFHVFPQFADGILSDGSSYRSTLMIQPSFSSSPVTCNLTLRGMTANFGSGSASSFDITIPANGWMLVRTAGTQSFQSGYATVTCNTFVDAQVLYAFYVGGFKASEATVFSSRPLSSFKLLADQTESARLGLAIANNTDIAHTYQITLVNATGSTFGTGTVAVGARQTIARFLDELLPATTGRMLQVQIRASDFSDFSIIGLRFTGSVFTTIPAN